MLLKKALIIYILTLVTFSQWHCLAQDGKRSSFDESLRGKIDSFVLESIKEVDYPGISIAIVKGKGFEYKKGYGYADLETEKTVTTRTLFEIGSNTKAFTGFGLLLLVEKGIVSLNDPVSRYIPWFKMKYDNEDQLITLSNLLYHTSGISIMAINDVYPSSDDSALEQTVRSIMQSSLESKPGKKFAYSTVNYDIIGHVIERVSGKSYEDYITTMVLQPLRMNESYFNKGRVFDDKNMATGYKIDYSGNIGFNAPVYRGNAPAGYLISDANDMLNWLKINLYLSLNNTLLDNVIKKTHKPDRSIKATQIFPYKYPFNYAAGWLVFEDDEQHITHGGSNPNFASYILLNQKDSLGIAVLGNRNSSYPYGICKGIEAIINDKEKPDIPTDLLYSGNKVLLFFTMTSFIFIALSAILFLRLMMQFKKGRRLHTKNKRVKALLTPLITLTIIGILLYFLPIAIYYGFPWRLIKIWGPFSLIPTLLIILLNSSIFSFYWYLKKIYPKQKMD